MKLLNKLKADIDNLTEKQLYSKYLLGQEVWFFKEHLQEKNYSEKYDELKHFISLKLDIHFNNIAIIGSAKTGFSFSPRKEFSIFSEDSDIDIIVVSEKYYKLIWSAYVDMFYREVIIKEYNLVNKCIFKGFISLKEPTIKHIVIENWVKKSEDFTKDLQLKFGIDNEVNYRIYDSWESVERYHLFGIRLLKQKATNEKLKNYRLQKDKIKQIKVITNVINLLLNKNRSKHSNAIMNVIKLRLNKKP